MGQSMDLSGLRIDDKGGQVIEWGMAHRNLGVEEKRVGKFTGRVIIVDWTRKFNVTRD